MKRHESKRLLAANKEDILSRYRLGEALKPIASDYGVGATTISNFIKESGEIVRTLSQANRTYTINDNFFEIVNNEETAYILGLLYADGCVYEPTYTVTINLKKEDSYLLSKIQKCLNNNGKLRPVNNGSSLRLDLNNIKLCKDVISLGCIPRKTHTLSFPTKVPNNLLHHFVRGYFDGDGSIYKIRTNIKYVTFTGNKLFCTELRQLLQDTLQSSLPKLISCTNTKSYRVAIYKKQLIPRLRDWMYKDSTIFLLRKQILFFHS